MSRRFMDYWGWLNESEDVVTPTKLFFESGASTVISEAQRLSSIQI
jgi:hypothetical protein